MKRWIRMGGLCMAVLLALGAAPMGAVRLETVAEEPTSPFEIVDGVLVKYTGTETDVVIPDGVTAIGDMAFSGNETLRSVILPDTVTSIGQSAFVYCHSLAEINLPQGLQSIGDGAFEQCGLGAVVIPDTVTSIGERAFEASGITSADIPASVTSIGRSAFARCSKLRSVRFAASVEEIGFGLFNGCRSLETVEIVSPIQRIADRAFEYCAFSRFTVPDTVTSLGSSVFAGNDSLLWLEVPESVTQIDRGALDGCSQMTVIGKAGSYVETYAKQEGLPFTTKPNYDIGREDFVIENGILRQYTGSGGDVVLPTGVTMIGSRAFADCDTLRSVTFSDTVRRVDQTAFYNCPNLEWIQFSASVETLSVYWYDQCPSLREIRVEETSGTFSSLDGILFNKQGTKLLYCPPGKSGTIEVPLYTAVICREAFLECDKITRILLPETIDRVEERAFSGCTLLEECVLPYSVTTLGEGMFAGCTSLTKIEIPERVSGIPAGFAQGCAGLTELFIPAGVREIDETAFDGCSRLSRLEVDGDNLTFLTIDNVLYTNGGRRLLLCPEGIEGTLTLPDSLYSLPDGAFENCGKLTEILLPDTITELGNWTFSGCTSLREVRLPQTTEPLQDVYGLFSGCESLISVRLPEGIRRLGDYMFYGCTSLQEVQFPTTMQEIGKYVFNGCTGLQTIEIPEGVTFMDIEPFTDCTGLKRVRLPSTFRGFATHLFIGCSSLTEIEVAESNPYLCTVDGVLYSKDKTELYCYPAGRTDPSFTVPAGVTYIDTAFSACGSLEEVRLPNSLEHLASWAFMACENLEAVYIPAGVTEIDGLAFRDCDRLTLYGVAGSAAEEYATENGIPFVADGTGPVPGDLNQDGRVNSSDARLILQYTVETIELTPAQLAVADLSGDGRINSSDARLALQAAVS